MTGGGWNVRNKFRKAIAVLITAVLALAGTSAFAADAVGEPQTPSEDGKMTTLAKARR